MADRQGDWTAIWYLGQKAWFYNSKALRRAVAAPGQIVTLKKGAKIWGMAYPAKLGVTPPADRVAEPLKYTVAAGQKYALLGSETGEYYHAVNYDVSKHVLVKDQTKYYEIQFGHRAYFVKAGDVTVSTAS